MDTEDFSKGFINRLRVPGVAAFELSSTPASHVAAFVPESKVCVPQSNAYYGSLDHFCDQINEELVPLHAVI